MSNVLSDNESIIGMSLVTLATVLYTFFYLGVSEAALK